VEHEHTTQTECQKRHCQKRLHLTVHEEEETFIDLANLVLKPK